jgi:hypothetical protein
MAAKQTSKKAKSCRVFGQARAELLAAKEFRADCQTAHSKGSWPSNNSGSNMSLMAT